MDNRKVIPKAELEFHAKRMKDREVAQKLIDERTKKGIQLSQAEIIKMAKEFRDITNES